jgi:fructuronate reductase
MKLPQRITVLALALIKAGKEPHLLALTVAAWLLCIAPFKEFAPGEYAEAMKDPAKKKIISLTSKAGDLYSYVEIFFNESGVFSPELSHSSEFVSLVKGSVERIYSHGLQAAISEAITS